MAFLLYSNPIPNQPYISYLPHIHSSLSSDHYYYNPENHSKTTNIWVTQHLWLLLGVSTYITSNPLSITPPIYIYCRHYTQPLCQIDIFESKKYLFYRDLVDRIIISYNFVSLNTLNYYSLWTDKSGGMAIVKRAHTKRKTNNEEKSNIIWILSKCVWLI